MQCIINFNGVGGKNLPIAKKPKSQCETVRLVTYLKFWWKIVMYYRHVLAVAIPMVQDSVLIF